MREILMIGAVLSALVAFSEAASAGMTETPAISVARPLLAADAAEMTVSNQYGYANLRSGPSTSNKLLDRLPEGTKVIAIEKVAGGSWIHVKVGAKDGYIQAKLLK